MSVLYRLRFPPRVWREQIPTLPGDAAVGVAHLGRNFFGDVRELIAHDLRPSSPGSRGRDFGPLDDLLLLRVQPAVDAGDAGRLRDEFAPLPMQVVVALVLGREEAAGRWLGEVWDGGAVHPLEGFTLVGPGMARVTAHPADTEQESPYVRERWSRTRGAVGEAVWRRLRQSCVAVVGAGRNGSAAALTLAMLGVGRLVLIDEDEDLLHNLDATVGATPAGLGRPKVHNRAGTLRGIRPGDLEVQALARPVAHPEAVEALRGADLIVTCVDRDSPRLAAAALANRWCKVHLDVGTGVFRTEAGRQMGADVRLLLPGEACVSCLGGLRNIEEAGYEAAAPAGALRRGRRREWHEERAGSLLTVNQAAVNLAVQMWLDLLAGLVTHSRWCRLEWGAGGVPAVRVESTPAACDLCRSRTAALPDRAA